MSRSRRSRAYWVASFISAVLVLSSCSSDSASSTTTQRATEPPGQVLLIGDSFTEGLSGPFVELAEARNPELMVAAEESAVGGTSLKGLWFGSSVRRIQQGIWDVVVLQDDPRVIGSHAPEAFFAYARKFDEEIAASGAETVLYMAWEAANHPVTIEEISDAYEVISSELEVKVAPAGIAFSNSQLERPKLDIFTGDGVHANARGVYLAISVLYATIFDESPEGAFWLSDDMAQDASMSEADAAFLERIAWQTVTEYREAK